MSNAPIAETVANKEPKCIRVDIKVLRSHEFTLECQGDFDTREENIRVAVNCLATLMLNHRHEREDRKAAEMLAARNNLSWLKRRWMDFFNPIYDSEYRKLS